MRWPLRFGVRWIEIMAILTEEMTRSAAAAVRRNWCS